MYTLIYSLLVQTVIDHQSEQHFFPFDGQTNHPRISSECKSDSGGLGQDKTFYTSDSLVGDVDAASLWKTSPLPLTQAPDILRRRVHSPSGSRTASTRLRGKNINVVLLKMSFTLQETKMLSKKAYPFYSLIVYTI